MSDFGDQAEAIEAMDRQLRIQAVVTAAGSDGDVGATECVDCDEEISAERRAAVPGARRCVGCQSARERRNRRA